MRIIKWYSQKVVEDSFRLVLDIALLVIFVLMFLNWQLAWVLAAGLIGLASTYDATDRAAARHYAFAGNRDKASHLTR